MDEIKREGLRNLLCPDCAENKPYRLTDGKSEILWCPHKAIAVLWADKFITHKLVVLPGVDDAAFFAMVQEGREGWHRAQAQAMAAMN